MNKIIIFTLSTLISCLNNCSAQADHWDSVTYHPPFDSLSIEYHLRSFNLGLDYLLLIKANNKSAEEYYLISTNSLNLEKENNSFQSIDSVLNGNISPSKVFWPIPIKKELLDLYAKEDICYLKRQVFDEKGIYREPHYRQSSRHILSTLIYQGAIIDIGDFDGTLLLHNESIDCSR